LSCDEPVFPSILRKRMAALIRHLPRAWSGEG
jgi:hypothetical protein